MAEQLPHITIYTDGACDPNPGPGGWAAILLRNGAAPEELSGGEEKTTNNRMELRAVVEALRALTAPHQITLNCDSEYVVQGITTRLAKWQRSGWQTDGGKEVKNQDLWQALLSEVARHEMECHWVKGHSGDPWNERADTLALAMLPRAELPLDDDAAIHIFTAVCCLGTESGAGGWAATLRYRQASKTIAGHEPNTSANRLLILAALEGLKAVKKPYPIHLYTNAGYLHSGITRWVGPWQQRGWRTTEGKPVSHRDLWQELLAAAAPFQVVYHLVPARLEPPEMLRTQKGARDAAQLRPAEVAEPVTDS